MGAVGERVKIMWYCVICLVKTSDQCDGINRLFSARGAFYLTAVITSERLSHLTVTSDALDSYMTTHFVGFLLIPRYNHDRIIREFRRPHRRTAIRCFVMEGYALIAVRR